MTTTSLSNAASVPPWVAPPTFAARLARRLTRQVDERPKLHVGVHALPGWRNVVFGERRGLPGAGVGVFASPQVVPLEQPAGALYVDDLEWLDAPDAVLLLASLRGLLGAGGRLRVVVRDLEGIWAGTYRTGRPSAPAGAAFAFNRAMRGDGARFVWNRALLDSLLAGVGYGPRSWPQPGESPTPWLRGLERRPEPGELAPWLIVEAGLAEPSEARLDEVREQIAVLDLSRKG